MGLCLYIKSLSLARVKLLGNQRPHLQPALALKLARLFGYIECRTSVIRRNGYRNYP